MINNSQILSIVYKNLVTKRKVKNWIVLNSSILYNKNKVRIENNHIVYRAKGEIYEK